jgi:hypothetical protein
MNGKIAYIRRIISWTIVFCGLIGCTYVFKTDDVPPLQVGSPLRSVSQKNFAFKEFKDIREVKDPLLIKKVELGEWKLDKPISSLVMLMLKKEFERNGHNCTAYSPQVKADYIVEGIIYKCSYSINQPQTANIEVKLIINPLSDHTRNVFMKSYVGEYSIFKSGAIWKGVLTRSLLLMIKEISTDDELIDYLGE